MLNLYRFIQHLKDVGFSKEKEIAFPHKQAAFMRLRRETFDGPTL
jgi:N5-hydroxyornithine acetyltransferase